MAKKQEVVEWTGHSREEMYRLICEGKITEAVELVAPNQGLKQNDFRPLDKTAIQSISDLWKIDFEIQNSAAKMLYHESPAVRKVGHLILTQGKNVRGECLITVVEGYPSLIVNDDSILRKEAQRLAYMGLKISYEKLRSLPADRILTYPGMGAGKVYREILKSVFAILKKHGDQDGCLRKYMRRMPKEFKIFWGYSKVKNEYSGLADFHEDWAELLAREVESPPKAPVVKAKKKASKRGKPKAITCAEFEKIMKVANNYEAKFDVTSDDYSYEEAVAFLKPVTDFWEKRMFPNIAAGYLSFFRNFDQLRKNEGMSIFWEEADSENHENDATYTLKDSQILFKEFHCIIKDQVKQRLKLNPNLTPEEMEYWKGAEPDHIEEKDFEDKKDYHFYDILRYMDNIIDSFHTNLYFPTLIYHDRLFRILRLPSRVEELEKEYHNRVKREKQDSKVWNKSLMKELQERVQSKQLEKC